MTTSTDTTDIHPMIDDTGPPDTPRSLPFSFQNDTDHFRFTSYGPPSDTRTFIPPKSMIPHHEHK